MGVAQPIVVNSESRLRLERQARGRTVPMRVALRSRIVLLAAEGKQHKEISEASKISPRMAALWRGRFLQQGVEVLLKDAPRPGRTPSIPTATVQKKTTQTTPANATHWSTRTMAREVGIKRGQRATHLACARTQAAPGQDLQGKSRSGVCW
jgi:transposase